MSVLPYAAKDRTSKAAASPAGKQPRADKAKEPKQHRSDRASGKPSVDPAKAQLPDKRLESAKQAAKDEHKTQKEPAAANTDGQKAAVKMDQDSGSKKATDGKQGPPHKADDAKDSKARADAAEKASRKRSRSRSRGRSRSRSPAKRHSGSQLNGKDSRSKRSSPDGSRAAKSSQQSKATAEKESRKEWLYSDNVSSCNAAS